MDALPDLRPVSEAYASLPVAEAFTWQDSSRELGDGEWYLVAFRSIRRPDADEAELTMYDELAHQEAATAPGFVHYYKGPTADDGSCLSFCLWLSRADARDAASRPAHLRAVTLIARMYQQYRLEFHRVRRLAGGSLTFEPYDATPPSVAEPRHDGLLPGLAVRPAAAF